MANNNQNNNNQNNNNVGGLGPKWFGEQLDYLIVRNSERYFFEVATVIE